MTQRLSSFTAGQVPAWAMDSLLTTATTRAKESLYRGYLHEVNNALAGVGTLAQALKGEDYTANELDPQLDLIVDTLGKTTALEKRVRSIFSIIDGNALPSAFSVRSFLEENKDILELLLPRSQRLSLDFPQDESVVNVEGELLWKFILVSLSWVRLSRSPEVTLRLVRSNNSAALSFELSSPVQLEESTQNELHEVEDALAYLARQNKVGFVNSQGALLFALGSYLQSDKK